MTKKELANILSEIFIPIGFKKKGDYWTRYSEAVTKIVNLQKSKSGNNFYINYGYILNKIPLDGLTMHVFNGLGADNTNENGRLNELLNFENNINEDIRVKELKYYIVNNLVNRINEVNTEVDLFNELKRRSHLNDIPLVFKKHFKLE